MLGLTWLVDPLDADHMAGLATRSYSWSSLGLAMWQAYQHKTDLTCCKRPFIDESKILCLSHQRAEEKSNLIAMIPTPRRQGRFLRMSLDRANTPRAWVRQHRAPLHQTQSCHRCAHLERLDSRSAKATSIAQREFDSPSNASFEDRSTVRNLHFLPFETANGPRCVRL